MQTIKYILLFSLFTFLWGCGNDISSTDPSPKAVSIKIVQRSGFQTKLVDDDNLESEQTIKNINVFFTEPSSDVIVEKYIMAGFSIDGDYQLISIPIEPEVLQEKDIYIIANYDDADKLEAITTVTEMKALMTPLSDKNNLLAPENGLCMFGTTPNFDFNSGSDEPAIVTLVRTCTKIRINLVFPENPTLSTNNSFLIVDAAKYTHVIENDKSTIPGDAYFTYATELPLTNNGLNQYVATTYIYESAKVPVLYIYTHMFDSPATQEYSARLPLPERNFLYNIKIEIYDSSISPTKAKRSYGYTHKVIIKVYDENGMLIEP